MWIVGFRELEGGIREPHLSGPQKVLARYDEIAFGAIALT
jgi:hypothetical protein